MRIVQVAHNYPPEFRGGVERAVETLSAGLVTRGHRVTVIAGSERADANAHVLSEVYDGVPVRRIVRTSRWRTPVDPYDPDVSSLYDALLDELQPDVVHVHHWWNLGDDIVRRAAARGYSTCVTLHDHFASCSLFFRMPDGETPCRERQTPKTCSACVGERFGTDLAEVAFGVSMRDAAFRSELAAAGRILAPSLAHSDRVKASLVLEGHVEVVPLGTRVSAPLEPRGVRFPEGPLRVLHFGNLCRLKGVEILAQAVERADPSGDGISLTLAGSHTEKDLYVGRARVLPTYDRATLRELAAEADIAVFPSQALESFGLVVDEALRLGLPVLAADRGALAERLGQRGVAFAAGDVDALAALLRGFLEHPAHLDILRRAPLPALWTPDDHVRRMEEVYDEVQGRPKVAVDLETPLRRRVRRYQERIFEVIGALQQPRDSSNATGEVSP